MLEKLKVNQDSFWMVFLEQYDKRYILFHLSFQEILDEVTDIDLVVNLKLPESVLIEKCLGRRICSECGKNFNVASINVKGENGRPGISMAPLPSPAQCVSKLITRSDDTEVVVKERLRIYNEKVLLFKRSSLSSLCTSLCTIPYMGSQNSSLCWNVCSPNEGTTAAEAK